LTADEGEQNHQEIARNIARDLLAMTEPPGGKILELWFRMSFRILALWALMQRSRRYLAALMTLDTHGMSDVGDTTLRSMWEYVVTARWLAMDDGRFELFARSHARDLRLLGEISPSVRAILEGFHEVLEFEFGDSDEERMPVIE
jgi:hypothetical protein